MKSLFFKIGKKAIFPQKVLNPSDGFHMAMVFILNVNQNVIQVENDENIKFFGQNPINIALKATWSVE